MSFLGNIFRSEDSSIKEVKIKDPSAVLTDLLKVTSGSSVVRKSDFNIFYQIIAFQGVKDGVGCSTLVANTALALADLGLNICVIDTSILAPCQDTLLKTNYRDIDKKNRVDWFDMCISSKSVLNVSKLNNKIGVLSFQNRNIVDLLSSNDSTDLVDLALTQLHSKYDIILIDICHEQSALVTACIQQAHQVIQVWSDSPHMIENIDSFITNNTICSCPLDKMRYVVTNMIVDDIPPKWDVIMKQYRFNHLANVGLSIDIARVVATGKPLYKYVSSSEDIQEFNNCIASIVCHILNIEDKQDNVEGNKPTKNKKNIKEDSKSQNKNNVNSADIITSIKDADTSLNKEVKSEVNLNEVKSDSTDNFELNFFKDEPIDMTKGGSNNA